MPREEGSKTGGKSQPGEVRGHAGGGVGVGALTLFNILRAAGESGVYRIFPISRGLTEFHTIFVSGLDSSVCIRPLQKGAAGTEDRGGLVRNERTTGQQTECPLSVCWSPVSLGYFCCLLTFLSLVCALCSFCPDSVSFFSFYAASLSLLGLFWKTVECIFFINEFFIKAAVLLAGK